MTQTKVLLRTFQIAGHELLQVGVTHATFRAAPCVVLHEAATSTVAQIQANLDTIATAYHHELAVKRMVPWAEPVCFVLERGEGANKDARGSRYDEAVMRFAALRYRQTAWRRVGPPETSVAWGRAPQ